MRITSFMKKTVLLCLCMLSFLTISCEKLVTVEKLPAPSKGSLAFDGENLWLASSDSVLYKFNPSGDVIDYIEVQVERISGLAFDGEHFWAAVIDKTKLYKMDRDGNVLATFDIPVTGWMGDLAFDGTNLLLVNKFLGKIHRINRNGEVLNSFELLGGYAPMSLTYHNGSLWCAFTISANGGSGYVEIYRTDMDGKIIETFIYPSEGTRLYGLTFDNNRLWCSETIYPGNKFFLKTDIESASESNI